QFNLANRDRNIFYRVDSLTHEVETAEFYADNTEYYFWSATRDGDKILLRMSADGDLRDRLYYLDINDLDFEPIE
ncbi:MAG: hypothetical protein K2N56_06780, partial [Oscillospiraceae bacterium]|nr:hypothetical protein [Oscillospiraceae bacterium]